MVAPCQVQSAAERLETANVAVGTAQVGNALLHLDFGSSFSLNPKACWEQPVPHPPSLLLQCKTRSSIDEYSVRVAQLRLLTAVPLLDYPHFGC
jgi:hypothetical protein